MMEFIVAIELGSSKIGGIVGKKNKDESIQVLAYVKEEMATSVRKGVVCNCNKTAQALTSVINRLEGKLQHSIAKVYVGIGGQSLHTVKNVVQRDLKEETIISENKIHEIAEENYGIKLPDAEILGVVPQEYKIGNDFQADPVGVACNRIEGHFLNIIARSLVKKNLERAFEQAKIDIMDMPITPIAAASVILTESERRSGCALIDFGADTTTVSVYKNNMLRFLIVLPLGGNNITRDITSLQVEEDEAESMKITYGNAIFDGNDNEEESVYVTESKVPNIKLGELNNVVEARTEEIIANVWNQIQSSGYADKLSAGIITTGGGANLKNLDEAIRRRTGLFKIRYANSICNEVHVSESEGFPVGDGMQNALLGLLFAGTENCAQTKSIERETVSPPPADLFDSDETLKRQKEDTEKPKVPKNKEEERIKIEKKAKKSRKSLMDTIKTFSRDIFIDEEMK
ncbi:Cell division protein FtsA [termite gut metagenome]|uniref:Cell division protein FtsA n=1 Tax=termite gut metagenome TaxID=433724 RepID=A0A5J4RHR1_9ZZZZ